MRNIPAVSYPVGYSSFQARSKWVLLLIAAATQWFWWAQSPDLHWTQIFSMLVLIVSVFLISQDIFQPVAGVLRWTGQVWTLETEGRNVEGHVVPRLDFQSRILLEFKAPKQSTTWLWMTCQDDSQLWTSLRRAIWTIHREADTRQFDEFLDPS